MKKEKIILVHSIRPDAIRLSLIFRELDKFFDVLFVSVGQHYSPYLHDVFFSDCKIRKPDINLHIGSGTNAEQVGKGMIEFEKVLVKEKPRFVVVLGDNNGSLSTSLATTKLNIPLVHIESGGRSYRREMQEEKNRKIIDSISDLLLCYTSEHRENLLREGKNPRQIFIVGNPIVDVLMEFLPEATKSQILKKLGVVEKSYCLVTLHRGETVDKKESLQEVLSALKEVYASEKVPIILVLMPRTKKRLQEFGLKLPHGVMSIEPLGFLDFLNLEKNARIILSDSGTCVEEAAILRVPCVTLRNKTERVELLEEGANILAGINKDGIVRAAKELMRCDSWEWKEDIYQRNTAHKICSILLGNWLEGVS